MPTEPKSFLALLKACFLKLFLALFIEPVFLSVLDAASIAVTHFFPALPPDKDIFLDFLPLFNILGIEIRNYSLKVRGKPR